MLNRFQLIYKTVRHFSSALYITGDKAHKHFAVLSPVIDFESQLKHKENLVENIKMRQLPIDINVVEERWKFFKEVEQGKNTLEQTRTDIGQRISYLMKLENDLQASKEIHKLKLHLKIIKDDLKCLRALSYSVEEGAALQVLNLPNVLHPKTPDNEELEIYRYLEVSGTKTQDHLTIGNDKGYIKYINHLSCYLASDAALFELSLQNYFSGELVDLKYLQFSNSDLAKSVVVEGCGTDPFTGLEVLTLEDIHCVHSDGLNRLHLVGASSLYSFMAYFTKHFIQRTQFPIKAFCSGRKYETVKSDCSNSLFNLNQSSEIGLFCATINNSDNTLDAVVDEIKLMYKPLGYHFRVVLMPANKLKRAESLRISVQMFSNHLQNYVEVGNVVFYDDYLSKRLLFNYQENSTRKFPNVIGGSLVNIHRVIGCVLEHNSLESKPLLNDFLLKFIF